MKYYIVAELRESYPSLLNNGKVYNDYVSHSSIFDLVSGINKLGYDCEYLGGIKELYAMYQTTNKFNDDSIFINYPLLLYYKIISGVCRKENLLLLLH